MNFNCFPWRGNLKKLKKGWKYGVGAGLLKGEGGGWHFSDLLFSRFLICYRIQLCLVHPAARCWLFYTSKHTCQQGPSQRLMHPTADDDFVKLLSTLCKICYAFEEKKFFSAIIILWKTVILSCRKMNLKISHKLR